MRIACLQFAPQVGEVDDNIGRADSVLEKTNPRELEDIDLLVLPELAFSGYNFKSLQEISPFLEPSGAGISWMWARAAALRYDCVVAAGYPEVVDVEHKWPTSPEYYNSLVVVNRDGEVVANYRKTYLYYTDETWALEGSGHYGGEIDGLGKVAMGICMDINPYKFQTPWHAYEFAFHVLEVKANLVILSMAWLTQEPAEIFTQVPDEPDMQTLTYWVQRLEPLIRDEGDEEIIVVFANRCGVEDNATYAGSSTVLGVRHGEVCVYGLLGRGSEEVLVVDTDMPPFAKLVSRPEASPTKTDFAEDVEDAPPTTPARIPLPMSPEDAEFGRKPEVLTAGNHANVTDLPMVTVDNSIPTPPLTSFDSESAKKSKHVSWLPPSIVSITPDEPISPESLLAPSSSHLAPNGSSTIPDPRRKTWHGQPTDARDEDTSVEPSAS